MNLDERLHRYRPHLDGAIDDGVDSRRRAPAGIYADERPSADVSAKGELTATGHPSGAHKRLSPRRRTGPFAAALAAVSIAAVLAVSGVMIAATRNTSSTPTTQPSSSPADHPQMLDLRTHVLTASDLPSGWKSVSSGAVMPPNECIPDLLAHPSGQGRALFLNQDPPAVPATSGGGQGVQEIATSFASTTEAHRSLSDASQALSNCQNKPIRLLSAGDRVSATAVPIAKTGDEAVEFSLRITTRFSGQAPTITPVVVTLVRVGRVRLELLVLGADVPGTLITAVTTRAVAKLPTKARSSEEFSATVPLLDAAPGPADQLPDVPNDQGLAFFLQSTAGTDSFRLAYSDAVTKVFLGRGKLDGDVCAAIFRSSLYNSGLCGSLSVLATRPILHIDIPENATDVTGSFVGIVSGDVSSVTVDGQAVELGTSVFVGAYEGHVPQLVTMASATKDVSISYSLPALPPTSPSTDPIAN